MTKTSQNNQFFSETHVFLVLQIREEIEPRGRCGWTAVWWWWRGHQAPVRNHKTSQYMLVTARHYTLYTMRSLFEMIQHIGDLSYIMLLCCVFVSGQSWRQSGLVMSLLVCSWCIAFLRPCVSMIRNEFTDQQKPAWAKPSLKTPRHIVLFLSLFGVMASFMLCERQL